MRHRVICFHSLVCFGAAAGMAVPFVAVAQDSERRIEEVVVTAERREATVSDTAISISTFDDELLDYFNIRNQEDLQNYIPATTIQSYDASMRGVGASRPRWAVIPAPRLTSTVCTPRTSASPPWKAVCTTSSAWKWVVHPSFCNFD